MNPTPHGRYLAIGTVIAVILSIGVGFSLFELVRIEHNLNMSAAASAETLGLVNPALKGTHKNGDDGLLVLDGYCFRKRRRGECAETDLEDTNRIAKQENRKRRRWLTRLSRGESRWEVVAKLGGAVDTLNGVIGEVAHHHGAEAQRGRGLAERTGLGSPAHREASTDLVTRGGRGRRESEGHV